MKYHLKFDLAPSCYPCFFIIHYCDKQEPFCMSPRYPSRDMHLHIFPRNLFMDSVPYTLINNSLNGYGESPSNGFHWKVCFDWILFGSKTLHETVRCDPGICKNNAPLVWADIMGFHDPSLVSACVTSLKCYDAYHGRS